MTGHLGYEKGDPAGGLFANSGSGSIEETVASEGRSGLMHTALCAKVAADPQPVTDGDELRAYLAGGPVVAVHEP
jgi:hypothetical protein